MTTEPEVLGNTTGMDEAEVGTYETGVRGGTFGKSLSRTFPPEALPVTATAPWTDEVVLARFKLGPIASSEDKIE